MLRAGATDSRIASSGGRQLLRISRISSSPSTKRRASTGSTSSGTAIPSIVPDRRRIGVLDRARSERAQMLKELSTAHQIGDQVKRAYDRAEVLDL